MEQLLEVVDFPPDYQLGVLDYDCAICNTMSEYLPMAKLTGCLFQFDKAIKHKLQALGLIGLFSQSQQFFSFAAVSGPDLCPCGQGGQVLQ